MSNDLRVAVIALDGFPYHLLKEISPSLPNISRLMANGSWGKLESTIPFITATAWTSFMTGKNPGKHGVMGFLSRKSDSPADVGRLVAGFSIRDPTLWRIMSDAGLKVGVLGVPMTYKPEQVNGFIVSGFPLPRHSTDYTQPVELREDLEQHGWNFADVPTQAYSKDQLDPFYEELRLRVKEKTDAVLYLLRKVELDFFMVHYFETDKVLHEYLNFRYKEYSDPQDYAKYGRHVDDFMTYLDSEIGRVLAALPSSTDVLVVSDHGLSPGNHVFLADTWLLKEKYIKVRNSPGAFFRHLLFRAGLTPELGFRVLPKGTTGQLLESFNSEYWEMEKPAKSGGSPFSKLLLKLPLDKRKDIDWEKSTAYSFGGYGVFNVYLTPRDASQARIEELKQEVVTKLRAVTYKGEPVFDKVLLDKDVYVWKTDRKDIPDIMAYDVESRYVAQTNPSFFTSNRFVARKYANRNEANHDRDGIFVFSGTDFGLVGERALSIMDVFPTILHLYGLSIEVDVDGKVASELFQRGSEAASRTPVYTDSIQRSAPISAFNDKEEQEITEKLRRMGYI